MGRLQIILFNDKSMWNNIVRSFEKYDVYYLNEYVSAFRYTNEGEPYLIYYCGIRMRLCYTVQQADIALFKKFNGILDQDRYYDWSTPYGYGGPLTDNFDKDEMKDFFDLISEYCLKSSIVSQFIRFHPLLENQKVFEGFCDLRKLKKTVYIDTADLKNINTNLEPRNRRFLKKAQKNNIEIKIDNSKNAVSAFIEMYRDTMTRKDASEYYYFSRMFFDDLFYCLAEHYELFCGLYDDKIICSAIIMHCNGSMHYHLGASCKEYMHLAPNNLLFYKAACWGAENGFSKFHLGGGVGIEDTLLDFKKSFNKNGLIDYYIGRNIFCTEKYKELMNLRATSDSNFNSDNNHMIQYRA